MELLRNGDKRVTTLDSACIGFCCTFRFISSYQFTRYGLSQITCGQPKVLVSSTGIFSLLSICVERLSQIAIQTRHTEPDCDHVVPVCIYDYGFRKPLVRGEWSVIVHVVRSPRSSRHLIHDIIQYAQDSGADTFGPQGNHPDSIRVRFHSDRHGMSLGPAGVAVM